MLNNDWASSRIKLFQYSTWTYPIVVLELGTLNMNVISVSLHVPSFPWTNVGLPIDCDSIITGSDVFSLSERSECPCSVDLLLSNKKLTVQWRWRDLERKPCQASSQVTISHSESKVLKAFASVAHVAEIFLWVEKCSSQSICIDFKFWVNNVGLFGQCVRNILDSLRSLSFFLNWNSYFDFSVATELYLRFIFLKFFCNLIRSGRREVYIKFDKGWIRCLCQ